MRQQKILLILLYGLWLPSVMIVTGPMAHADLISINDLPGLSVYDDNTGQSKGQPINVFLDLGQSIEGLAFGPDRNLYLSGESFVFRLNYETDRQYNVFVAPVRFPPQLPPGIGSRFNPGKLVFGPDNNLYVANLSNLFDGSIVRFDGTTGSLMDAFVPSHSGGLELPYALAFGPDGDLYVAGRVDASNTDILRYDGHTGSFLGTVVTGLTNPRDLAIGPDGNLYIAESTSFDGDGGGSILRYNITDGIVERFVPTGVGGLSDPWSLAFGPDGNLYVGDFSGSGIRRYNGSTGEFIDLFVNGHTGMRGQLDNFDIVFSPAASVPEPTSLMLFGSGLVGLVYCRRKQAA